MHRPQLLCSQINNSLQKINNYQEHTYKHKFAELICFFFLSRFCSAGWAALIEFLSVCFSLLVLATVLLFDLLFLRTAGLFGGGAATMLFILLLLAVKLLLVAGLLCCWWWYPVPLLPKLSLLKIRGPTDSPTIEAAGRLLELVIVPGVASGGNTTTAPVVSGCTLLCLRSCDDPLMLFFDDCRDKKPKFGPDCKLWFIKWELLLLVAAVVLWRLAPPYCWLYCCCWLLVWVFTIGLFLEYCWDCCGW